MTDKITHNLNAKMWRYIEDRTDMVVFMNDTTRDIVIKVRERQLIGDVEFDEW